MQIIVEELEKKLICPINLTLMKNPVITSCGHTFEQEAIKNIQKTNSICPICQQKFSTLTRNFLVKRLIQDLKMKYIQTIEKLKQNCLKNCNDQIHWATDAGGNEYSQFGNFHSYQQITDVVGAASDKEIDYVYSSRFPSNKKAHIYAGYVKRKQNEMINLYQPQESIDKKYWAVYKLWSVPCYSCYTIFRQCQDQIEKIKNKLDKF